MFLGLEEEWGKVPRKLDFPYANSIKREHQFEWKWNLFFITIFTMFHFVSTWKRNKNFLSRILQWFYAREHSYDLNITLSRSARIKFNENSKYLRQSNEKRARFIALRCIRKSCFKVKKKTEKRGKTKSIAIAIARMQWNEIYKLGAWSVEFPIFNAFYNLRFASLQFSHSHSEAMSIKF